MTTGGRRLQRLTAAWHVICIFLLCGLESLDFHDSLTLPDKYLNPHIPVEDQIKFWLAFAGFTCSNSAGVASYAGCHGSGSPIMEQIVLTLQYDIPACEQLIKDLAGMQS